MSYTMMICRKPVPKNKEEAWEYIEKISEESNNYGKDLPKDVMKLYNALTKRYPCICELPDDRVDEEGIWSDGPLINDFSADYICIGIVFSKVDEALSFIIKTANELGFVVFDPQEGKIN